MIAKLVIEKNFSKYAEYYDSHCSIQNLCAQDLIDIVRPGDFNSILDIGCGTGNFTVLLREAFPKAGIKAIDISSKMVELAGKKLSGDKIKFIIGDAEEGRFHERFDLICSNASFQWFENPEETLSRYKNFLHHRGVIAFSAFGPKTFHELHSSLNNISKEEASISSQSFLKIEDLEQMMKRYFGNIEVKKRLYKERYASLTELLKKIKYSGIRGNSVSKGMWSPATLSELEKIYKNLFEEIIATYEVFFFRGTAL